MRGGKRGAGGYSKSFYARQLFHAKRILPTHRETASGLWAYRETASGFIAN
jgi:hypothetical protein